MSRIFTSSFRRSSEPSEDPLLGSPSSRSERSGPISLQNLSPQPSRSPAVSPSPPPSFYRLKTPTDAQRSPAQSSSPSKTRGRGKIMFAAPPPPIAVSVMLPSKDGRSGSRAGSEQSFDGVANVKHSPQTSIIRRRRGSDGSDPLIALNRRERALQEELQELLDAQSAGLIQGFGGREGSEGSEAGSSTPTHNSTRSRSAGLGDGKGRVVPVRQPKKKVLSLRGARRGLLRDMVELAAIKSQESSILSDSIAQRQLALQKVAKWEKRIEIFQKQLSTEMDGAEREEGEEGRDLAELKNEEKALESEIREMEDRLAQMRARKRWIQERVREGENRREARLSSYRGALREVEGEVKDFLRRPPMFLASSIAGQVDDGFMDLPVGRRTLGMAKDLWSSEITHIESLKADTEKEREALEEGAKVWGDSARQVTEFEDGLREQMKGKMDEPEMLRGQVRDMGRVIEGLEYNMRVAEGRGWNLLICALGAELEAFREGEGILKSALGMFDNSNGVDDGKLLVDNVDEPEEEQNDGRVLNVGQDRDESLRREDSTDREDSEDEPNLAELLVDKDHRDGESSLD